VVRPFLGDRARIVLGERVFGKGFGRIVVSWLFLPIAGV
jgi:hypothetical protein